MIWGVPLRPRVTATSGARSRRVARACGTISGGGCREGSEADPACPQSRDGRDFFFSRVQPGQYGFRVADEDPARFGEPHPAPVPHHEGRAHFRFEAGNVVGDGGLGVGERCAAALIDPSRATSHNTRSRVRSSTPPRYQSYL